MNAARELEDLVDRTSLQHVLTILSEMCHAKAEHVGANWQDDRLAKRWTRAGVYLDNCAGNSAVANLPV